MESHFLEMLYEWKVNSRTIQFSRKNEPDMWYDMTDAQVIKDLVVYNMLKTDHISYRLKPCHGDLE